MLVFLFIYIFNLYPMHIKKTLKFLKVYTSKKKIHASIIVFYSLTTLLKNGKMYRYKIEDHPL